MSSRLDTGVLINRITWREFADRASNWGVEVDTIDGVGKVLLRRLAHATPVYYPLPSSNDLDERMGMQQVEAVVSRLHLNARDMKLAYSM